MIEFNAVWKSIFIPIMIFCGIMAIVMHHKLVAHLKKVNPTFLKSMQVKHSLMPISKFPDTMKWDPLKLLNYLFIDNSKDDKKSLFYKRAYLMCALCASILLILLLVNAFYLK